jgi:hypothetical protein
MKTEKPRLQPGLRFEAESEVASLRIVTTSNLNGYVPPVGFRVKCAYRLSDGSFEIILEPL